MVRRPSQINGIVHATTRTVTCVSCVSAEAHCASDRGGSRHIHKHQPSAKTRKDTDKDVSLIQGTAAAPAAAGGTRPLHCPSRMPGCTPMCQAVGASVRHMHPQRQKAGCAARQPFSAASSSARQAGRIGRDHACCCQRALPPNWTPCERSASTTPTRLPGTALNHPETAHTSPTTHSHAIL